MYKGKGVLIYETVLQCPQHSPSQKLWRIAEMLYFLVTLIKERISDTPPPIHGVGEILVLRKEDASSEEVSSKLSQFFSWKQTSLTPLRHQRGCWRVRCRVGESNCAVTLQQPFGWLAISPTDVRVENRSSVGILCSPCSQGYNLFLIPPSVCTPRGRELAGRQPGFAGLSYKTYLPLRMLHLFAEGTAPVLTAVGSAAIENAPSDPLAKTVLLV